MSAGRCRLGLLWCVELPCCWRLLVKVDAWLALSPASPLSQCFEGVCHNTMALCHRHSLTTMCFVQPTAASGQRSAEAGGQRHIVPCIVLPNLHVLALLAGCGFVLRVTV